MFHFLKQFFLIGFLAAGLTACTTSMIKEDLTPLQDAYQVRDSIIIAKKGLNDARALGKISKDAYDKAWKTAEDADKIVVQQINTAHRGMVSKSALKTADAKIDEVAVVNGGVR